MPKNEGPKSKKAKAEEQDVAHKPDDGDDDDDDSVSSEEAGEDLILEGVLIRNPDVSDSDDSSDDDEEEEDKKKPAKGGKKDEVDKKNDKSKKRKRKKPHAGPDVTQVDFTFWDMREKFFHGLKTLLHSTSTIYAAQSSSLADLMIENVSVGTLISTEGDVEGIVFGFASVLNVTMYQEQNCIKYLKKMCLDKCPAQHKEELEVVLSGKTKRPAGFLLHGRMANLPLEIVEVLHQQLVLDMDWAVENAEGGEEERKALNFGAFVRLAPATSAGGGNVEYKYFDDEIFSNNAEFCFTIDAPKSFGADTKQLCSVIVMTKTGHRDAMKEIKRLVGS